MIIVTGASGKLGSAVVEGLLERVPASQIGVSVRDPEKAKSFADRGVRVRRGDFDDSDSLQHAFEGASQVLLVSSNAASRGGDPLVQHRTAIEASRAAGARRVLYTSHMGASAVSKFPPMRDHAATESMLMDSGLAFTSFRNGFYANTVPLLMGNAFETREIAAPEDGPVSWTAHADLSEAIAVVLANEGAFDGITPALTGSEALDLSAIARVVIGDEEFRTALSARGMPTPVIDISMGLYAASRAGEFAAVDGTLERLLKRPLASVRESLAKEARKPSRR
ncbi:NAD-dependent epimerase/dehydratase family protein [bacterium]|nr:MAG: NAD-dependent epimerase/dehydratase family protein [bacterium]